MKKFPFSPVLALMFCAAGAQAASEPGGKIIFEQGSTIQFSTVIDGKPLEARHFDGVRIVRLADGNCQLESHRVDPDKQANPLGKSSVTTSLIGYDCLLSQTPGLTALK